MSQGRPSFLKREREKAKRERRENKAARRAEASARQAATADRGQPTGEDPDIAGIRLGPQPPQE
jgi:hypothetical protein